MEDSTTPPALKRCSKGDKCLNPLGCWLPATTEYFHKKLDGLAGTCKVCRRAKDKEVFSDPERRRIKNERQKQNQKRYKDKYRARAKELQPRYSENRRQRKLTDPEYAQRLKEQSKARHSTPEYCERERIRHRQKYREDETYRQKQRDYHRNMPDEKREAANAKRRERYASDPEYRERQRSTSRKLQLENKDRYSATQRAKAQTPEYKEKRRKYRQRPEAKVKDRFHRQSRRARQRSLPSDFTPQDWGQALEYFGGICPVCGRQFYDLFGEREAHADHWIPIVSPECPGTVRENIIPLCGGADGCNQSKHAREPVEWLTERYGKRKAHQILKKIQTYFEWVRKQSRN